MPVFLGNKGNIKLRRSSKITYYSVQDSIIPDDVNLALNRLTFERSVDNLLTGDRIDITTNDSRGLAFLVTSIWSDNVVHSNVSLFINVNALGGLRFFSTFEDAVNNNRANEVQLKEFAGSAIDIAIQVRDARYNWLGNVSGYRFSTDRDAIDTTSLSDKFKQQYAAGLISGSGSIDCYFDYSTDTDKSKEPASLILQIIQRVDIGCEFDLALYLSDKEIDPEVQTVFYDLIGVVTNAGVEVTAGGIITCSVDFVTTGEVRLLFGKPSDYILKEDDDRVALEQSLDFLLQEIDD